MSLTPTKWAQGPQTSGQAHTSVHLQRGMMHADVNHSYMQTHGKTHLCPTAVTKVKKNNKPPERIEARTAPRRHAIDLGKTYLSTSANLDQGPSAKRQQQHQTICSEKNEKASD